MKKLSRHKTFVKDAKKANLTDGHTAKLFDYVARLLNDNPLPPEALAHFLKGEEWLGCSELHVGGDVLLIYNTVELLGLGSHAQLLKM